MAASSSGSPVNRAVQLAWTERSYLVKFVVAEVVIVLLILVLFSIQGDFTRQNPSMFGLAGAILAGVAIIVALLTVMYVIGMIVIRGYSFVSRR